MIFISEQNYNCTKTECCIKMHSLARLYTALTSSSIFWRSLLCMFGSNSLVDDVCQRVCLQYWSKQQLTGVAGICHFIHHLHTARPQTHHHNEKTFKNSHTSHSQHTANTNCNTSDCIYGAASRKSLRQSLPLSSNACVAVSTACRASDQVNQVGLWVGLYGAIIYLTITI